MLSLSFFRFLFNLIASSYSKSIKQQLIERSHCYVLTFESEHFGIARINQLAMLIKEGQPAKILATAMARGFFFSDDKGSAERDEAELGSTVVVPS